MDIETFVLTAMSCADDGEFTPVQLQKYFFVIEKKLKNFDGTEQFHFKAWDYGPFDATLYKVLGDLENKGLAAINVTTRIRKYRLTSKGLEIGKNVFDGLDQKHKEYLKKLADFIRTLSFSELVSSIYKAYPEMKINSVFNQV